MCYSSKVLYFIRDRFYPNREVRSGPPHGSRSQEWKSRSNDRWGCKAGRGKRGKGCTKEVDMSYPSKNTTKTGYVNKNGQVVVRDTGEAGTDFGARNFQLACSRCGHNYGANSGDVWERKCPRSPSEKYFGLGRWHMTYPGPHRIRANEVIRERSGFAFDT